MQQQELEEMKSSGKNNLDGYLIGIETRPEFLVAGTCSFPQTFTGRKFQSLLLDH
jgi:hypothetical protein